MIIKKIKPMFTSILVTANRYGIDDVPKGVIIDPKKMQGTIKEVQTVVAIGGAVREVKNGDMIVFNPERFGRWAPYKAGDGMREMAGKEREFLGYEFPIIKLDGVEHMLIEERDVTFVIEEFAEDKDPIIAVPDKHIIGV